MSLRVERELRTIAETLDFLLSGRVAEAGDILMQRFRALEMASSQGSWELAKHMELIPDSAVTCVPVEMRSEALRRQALLQRVNGKGGRREYTPRVGEGRFQGATARQSPNQWRDNGDKHVSFDLDQADRKSVLRATVPEHERHEATAHEGSWSRGPTGKAKGKGKW